MFCIRGGFSIRRKGLNDPNKCHHSQPLPGNNKYIYIHIYPLMGTGSCSTSILNTSLEMPTATGHDVVMSCLPSVLWLMNVGSDIIKYYNMIYIYYIYTYIHILSPLLLCTIINIIIYYYHYHYCCYNIIICIGDCHIHFESQ